MTAPDPAKRPTPAARQRRVVRLGLIILAVVALTALAASLQLRPR